MWRRGGIMICCSSECSKSCECGRYIHNLSAKYRNGCHQLEPLATYGWGSISVDKCENHYVCGANGDYAMYEPIETACSSEVE